ncbi:hypothetical protein CC78DRAFT_571157 [Lojkania enalia]|uniref:Mediator of RNA polymerase II transcription subunit 1 n=1 Tax=Lojkania enalia TaxID=147567 RepID=A0A9P4K1U6_9PLEO|nr:hypothetical protein CC78DRAFT_571157 [Didymosphaeria enalia]
MATPTPSTNTPQKHLPAFSSPAPRSVPGTGTIPVNFDSPAALGIAFEGGVGMGISMSGMGMSQLGLSASAMGRADEEERRRRLESVIATLKSRPGRVGEEGIIELCKKEGLEVVREPQGSNGVMLTILIGSETLCEIPVRNGEIESVKLELASDRDAIGFGPSGSKILLNSLRPLPAMTKINLTLERFSHNLDKLLRMDKLSAPENGGVSCYTAIFGVYTSLRKLFEHEKKMALAVMEANTPYASQKAEREVLCKKSGRPRINAGSLGLSLEYWMDRRHLISKKAKPHQPPDKGKDKMDIDSEPTDPNPSDQNSDPETNKIYSLTIECEASQSSMYPPIRLSDSWISDAIEKAPDVADSDINNILLNRSNIDWLDPPPTYLKSPQESGHDAMNLDNDPGRLPNIRFIAKFNPPLVVPLSVADTLNRSLALEELPNVQPTTFVGLALRPGDPDPGLEGIVGASTQELRSQKTVLVIDRNGNEAQRVHTNSLYIPKPEWSRTIEALPFHHPRQLVEILPTLRQYAFLTSVLQDSFAGPSIPDIKATETSSKDGVVEREGEGVGRESVVQLDISLSYTPPNPRLTLHIPRPDFSKSSFTSSALLDSLLGNNPPKPPIHVAIDVCPNADLLVADGNVEKDGEIDVDGKRIVRALEVCGDLGVWGEWVRREVGGGTPIDLHAATSVKLGSK